jgi:hypothetical protein
MARVELEALEGQDLARIYIAAKLRDARRAEEVFTAQAVDYVVSVEPVLRSLFGSTRNAAVFSVPADRADACAEFLIDAGLGQGVVANEKR